MVVEFMGKSQASVQDLDLGNFPILSYIFVMPKKH